MTLDEAISHAREVAREKRAEEQEWRDKKDFIESNERNPKGIYDLPINQCKECAIEHEQLASWLTELQERREADRWIPVSERLPEDSGFYLVTRLGRRGDGIVDMAYYLKSSKEFECHDVTHWEPLPKPYESEAGNEQD